MESPFDLWWLVILVFWPGVVIACGLLSMLVHWTFSWSELVFDHLAGVVIGIFFFYGTEPGAHDATKFFMVFSTGVPGILQWAGVEPFVERAHFFAWAAGTVGGATLVAGLLDIAAVAIGRDMSVGGGFFSGLIALFKLPFSLVTTSIGILFFLVGMFVSFARTNTRIGYLGGVLYVEWDTPGNTSATTIGSTVQIWSGNFKDVMRHELYHSRQYMYFHDWMIPFWLLGMIWGVISAAISNGTVKWEDAIAADATKEVGNPMEIAAYHSSS